MGHLSCWILGALVGLLIGGVAVRWAVTANLRRRARTRDFIARVRKIHARRLQRLQANAQRHQHLAEVGVLTGGLAHEIKNPLSTVQLNLQLLREDLDSTNPAYNRLLNRLATVQRETSRLRDILDDFLRYAGQIELDRKSVDLNKMLEELVDFFTPQAQSQKVQLRLKSSPAPLLASVDARLIKQALLNLLLNAVQAMPGGGELILTLTGGDHEAIIDVIDTGGGIPADAVQKIFQAYYSTKQGGTGLGLPMARRIVEEHGGSITVRSDIGKGSDFSIHLPLSKSG